MPVSATSWSSGAPKWAAVVVLGGASLAGLGWAFGRESAAWGRSGTPAQTLPRDVRPVESKAAETKPEPAKVEVSSPAPVQPVAAASPRKLINVNTATQAELELLPGIGPSLAKRIMEYRASHAAFKRVEDLDPVKGIGPRMIEKLRPLVGFE